MIDSAAISIWLTDLALLGLAYAIGRIHAGAVARDTYMRQLDRLIDEVSLLHKKVDHLERMNTP